MTREAPSRATRLAAWLGRLGRITSGGQFIPQVDGLRFIAIAAVVLYHLNGHVVGRSAVQWSRAPSELLLFRLLEQGHFRVPLFFALSGFILALPFARYRLRGGQRVGLRGYFLRRVTRLEPPYLLNLAVGSFIAVRRRGIRSVLPRFVASAAYAHNLLYHSVSAINGVAWSLEIEVQFYLLAPLLACVFAVRRAELRRALLGALLVLATAVSVAATAGATPEWVRWCLLQHLQYFLVGLLLADIYLVDWQESPQRSGVWTIAGWLVWGTIVVAMLSDWTVKPWLLPWLVLLAYCAVFRSPLFAKALARPSITTVGGMCYTIYLYHYMVMAVVGKRVIGFSAGTSYELNLLLQAVLTLPAVLLFCGALFWAVERPCMRRDWPQQLRRRLGAGLFNTVGLGPRAPSR